MEREKHGWGLLLPAVVLIAGAALYLVLWAAGAYLIVADPLRPVDSIAVLSGGDAYRMQEAARLYKNEVARELILTETEKTQQELESGKSYSSVQKRLDAVALGVPSAAVQVTRGKSTSTLDEAGAILNLMRRDGLNSVIVVTDPAHTRRARMIFRESFRGSGLTVLVRPVGSHWYRSNTWMFRLDGWQATLSEYFKLLAYAAGVKGD